MAYGRTALRQSIICMFAQQYYYRHDAILDLMNHDLNPSVSFHFVSSGDLSIKANAMPSLAITMHCLTI